MKVWLLGTSLEKWKDLATSNDAAALQWWAGPEEQRTEKPLPPGSSKHHRVFQPWLHPLWLPERAHTCASALGSPLPSSGKVDFWTRPWKMDTEVVLFYYFTGENLSRFYTPFLIQPCFFGLLAGQQEGFALCVLESRQLELPFSLIHHLPDECIYKPGQSSLSGCPLAKWDDYLIVLWLHQRSKWSCQQRFTTTFIKTILVQIPRVCHNEWRNRKTNIEHQLIQMDSRKMVHMYLSAGQE